MTLSEIEAMLEATTPGDWTLVQDATGGPKRSWWEIRSGRRPVVHSAEFTRHRGGEDEFYSGVQMTEADAQFLASSKAIVRQLLAEKRQLMADLEDNTDKKLCALNGVDYNEWLARQATANKEIA